MRKIAFLFPGQGSQFIGMGKELYDKYDIVKDLFHEANDVLNYDIKKICFEGNLLELGKVTNMLEAILITSVAAFKVYMNELGYEPSFMMGHSLGEYSALTCSQAIKFEDALKIVKKRSELALDLVKECDSHMSIIEGMDSITIDKLCKERSKENEIVSLCCYNSRFQNAISGTSNAVMDVEDSLISLGAKVTPLFMSPPFHSAVMNRITKGLREELEKYEFSEPKWPVISNATGKLYSKNDIVDNLVKQVIYPVKWIQSIDFLRNNEVEFAIELGPKGIFHDLINSEIKGLRVFDYNNYKSKESLLKLISVNGKLYNPNIIDKCLTAAVGTKNNSVSDKEYIEAVSNSYEKIRNAGDDIENLTEEKVKFVIEELKNILNLKKVPSEEQKNIIAELYINA